MKTRILYAPCSIALASILLMACGKQNDERQDGASSSLLSDSGEGEAAVAASMNEALESLSDTNVSNSGTSLALAGDISFNIDRSCAEQDGKALVSISIDKSVSWERENARISFAASASVQSELSRTWSKEGGTVGCSPGGKFAAISMEDDLSGYALDVALDRSADRSVERTVLKTGEKTTQALTSSVKGERHVQWISQSTLEDGSISREKTISFATERAASYVAKDGSTKDLSLTLNTDADAPLQVTVVWDKLTRDRQLLSKLIESGKIKAAHAGDGYIEASFDKLLMTFSTQSCAVYSGSMEAKIYAEGASTAGKIYRLTAEAGTISVQDITDPANPKDVDDFDYTPCDLKDFNF